MPGKNVQKDEAQSLGTLKGIRQILDLMNEQGISEFELENNGFRVRIKRGVGPAASESQPPVSQPHFGIVHPVAPAPHSAPVAETKKADPTPAEPANHHPEGLYVIKSPIVGTFYTAAGPDAPAFVQVGDKVRQGQVLCIIEAMKLMNEIEAEVAGKIAEILVENGQPVEYGQALFGLTLSPPA